MAKKNDPETFELLAVDPVNGGELNDSGNANRFAEQWAGYLFYVPERGGWVVWNGKEYVRDAFGEVIQCACATARSIMKESIYHDDKDGLFEWSVESGNWHRIDAMLQIAVTDPRIVVTAEELGELEPKPKKLQTPTGRRTVVPIKPD